MRTYTEAEVRDIRFRYRERIGRLSRKVLTLCAMVHRNKEEIIRLQSRAGAFENEAKRLRPSVDGIQDRLLETGRVRWVLTEAGPGGEHQVHSIRDGEVIAVTGTGELAAQNARILTGAWNYLYGLARGESE